MTDTTPIPITLNLIKRGAVVDWKATAVRDHLALMDHAFKAVQSTALITSTLSEVVELTARLSQVSAVEHAQYHTLKAIRAHWSAFLLPKELR